MKFDEKIDNILNESKGTNVTDLPYFKDLALTALKNSKKDYSKGISSTARIESIIVSASTKGIEMNIHFEGGGYLPVYFTMNEVGKVKN